MKTGLQIRVVMKVTNPINKKFHLQNTFRIFIFHILLQMLISLMKRWSLLFVQTWNKRDLHASIKSTMYSRVALIFTLRFPLLSSTNRVPFHRLSFFWLSRRASALLMAPPSAVLGFTGPSAWPSCSQWAKQTDPPFRLSVQRVHGTAHR